MIEDAPQEVQPAAKVKIERPRPPSRKLIRFYNNLCRQLGMSYEAAAQQQKKFKTSAELQGRVEDLLLMIEYKKHFDKNPDKVELLFMVLEREILTSIKESKTEENVSWQKRLTQLIESDSFDIRPEFKLKQAERFIKEESAWGTLSVKGKVIVIAGIIAIISSMSIFCVFLFRAKLF